MNRESEPPPVPSFESIAAAALNLFWERGEVPRLTEGPYLLDYVHHAYKQQVDTPEQVGRVLTELLLTDAVVQYNAAMELGAWADQYEHFLADSDVPLHRLVEWLSCLAIEQTLLTRHPDVFEEDARRGDAGADDQSF